MTKSTLISEVAKRSGKPVAVTESIVNALFDTIGEVVAGGDKVHAGNLGYFELRERSARTARNPRTGEAVEVPAKKVPAFNPSKSFRDTCAK